LPAVSLWRRRAEIVHRREQDADSRGWGPFPRNQLTQGSSSPMTFSLPRVPASMTNCSPFATTQWRGENLGSVPTFWFIGRVGSGMATDPGASPNGRARCELDEAERQASRTAQGYDQPAKRWRELAAYVEEKATRKSRLASGAACTPSGNRADSRHSPDKCRLRDRTSDTAACNSRSNPRYKDRTELLSCRLARFLRICRWKTTTARIRGGGSLVAMVEDPDTMRPGS
jgi:hypothetical protein